MKLGILTYHRSHNYGALLQAVALRKALEKMGHDVHYVDYWPDYHVDMYRIISHKYLKSVNVPRKIKALVSTALRLPGILRRRQRFNKFIKRHIEPYCIPTSEHTDCIICGSDQIWRKQPGMDYRFNPVYFGAYDLNTDQYISYAASMGIINWNEQDKQLLKSWLCHFDKISVRETDLKKELDHIGVNDVEVSLDPTLLLSQEEWRKIITIPDKKDNPYILVYDLQGGVFDMEASERFANERNLKIKKLKGGAYGFIPHKDDCKTAGPEEMVRLIANAEYVFTSSFHGLVFSIIFQREFFASFVKNSGRASSLLSLIQLQERLIPPMTKDIPVKKNIDFKNVEEILSLQRNKSINYLRALEK